MGDRFERVADELHVLVERHAEHFRAGDELFAVHATRKGLVLHLLAHGGRLDGTKRLVGLDQRARDHESAHLVDCVEGLARVAVAGNVEVISVRGDVFEDVFRPAFLAQHLDSAHRMQLRRGA